MGERRFLLFDYWVTMVVVVILVLAVDCGCMVSYEYQFVMCSCVLCCVVGELKYL